MALKVFFLAKAAKGLHNRRLWN